MKYIYIKPHYNAPGKQWLPETPIYTMQSHISMHMQGDIRYGHNSAAATLTNHTKKQS